MATSGQGIWFGLGYGDSVRDYRHAARIFGTNDFARAPKNKFNFYVTITLNPSAASDNFDGPPDFGSEISYLVKTVELPKFDIEVQDINQYNRKVVVQKQIKYNPVTIKFHDDNTGTLRRFWQSYYNYYYNDGRYTAEDFDYSASDLYNTRTNSKWGLDTNAVAPYISKIEIYSMYHSIRTQKITLLNPIISSFSHDSHDYADNTGLMESTMQVHYTGVLYEDNIDASTNIEGFGQSSNAVYDTEFSPLTDGSGQQVDPATGDLYDPASGTSAISYPSRYAVDSQSPQWLTQQQVYNSNPTTPNYFTDAQLAAIVNNNALVPSNAGYLFPTADPFPVVYNDYGAVDLGSGYAYSEGIPIYPPSNYASIYQPGSWQQSLYQKGYNQSQIGAAQAYVKKANIPPGPKVRTAAETYIQNSQSDKLAVYGKPDYGQPASKPTQINFSNPSTSTQPVYNSQDWKSNLAAKGYSKSELATAEKFLSTVKVAPGTNLTDVAANYIKNNKGKQSIGAGTTTAIKKVTKPNSAINGPNFNPVAPGTGGSGVNPELIAQYNSSNNNIVVGGPGKGINPELIAQYKPV